MSDKTSTKTNDAKTIADSRVRLSQFMHPDQANGLGNVHGGEIMKLVDEAGALAAMRHARSPVVTVVMDSMTFMEPIYVGNLITLDAELTYVGTTSMEARVEVLAENVLTGTRTYTNTAYLVYVAIDAHGRPHPVPKLLLTTDTERAEAEAAQARQVYRKEQREREKQRKQQDGHASHDHHGGQR
ncbi:MAG TPA: acyl-CoA thioesterase [Aggregatilineales bacterium]|nr:acyl-CoA thioesterase [Aggregatilineales bacterium]